jgi:hypothetical protein
MRPLLLASLLLLAPLVACQSERTVEQQIISVIKEMEENGEAGRRGAFMERVHVGFVGQEGRLTRDEFQQFMILQWNRNQRLHARLFPIQVREDWEGQASARFKVLVTGGRGYLPERGQVFEVFTVWQLDEGDWLLLRADWVPVEFEEIMPSV